MLTTPKAPSFQTIRQYPSVILKNNKDDLDKTYIITDHSSDEDVMETRRSSRQGDMDMQAAWKITKLGSPMMKRLNLNLHRKMMLMIFLTSPYRK